MIPPPFIEVRMTNNPDNDLRQPAVVNICGERFVNGFGLAFSAMRSVGVISLMISLERPPTEPT